MDMAKKKKPRQVEEVELIGFDPKTGKYIRVKTFKEKFTELLQQEPKQNK